MPLLGGFQAASRRRCRLIGPVSAAAATNSTLRFEVSGYSADDVPVKLIHRCGFCGWSRDASSEVMIAPRCGACGCMLESMPKDAIHADGARPAFAGAHTSRLAKPLGLLVVATLLIAAGRAGYTTGGITCAVVATALMAFLLLPFTRS